VIKYTLEASSKDVKVNDVFKEFHDFIIYYIISNKMDLAINNVFLDDKAIQINDDSINEIVLYFQVQELETAIDIVLTEEEAERIKKLLS